MQEYIFNGFVNWERRSATGVLRLDHHLPSDVKPRPLSPEFNEMGVVSVQVNERVPLGLWVYCRT